MNQCPRAGHLSDRHDDERRPSSRLRSDKLLAQDFRTIRPRGGNAVSFRQDFIIRIWELHLRGGPVVYGALMAGFGGGALLTGLSSGFLRQVLSAESLLKLACFACAACSACQSAFDWDPLSASKRDPFDRRALLVALGSSELVGVAETARAR
ncbi:MFS transporter, partial [Bradyrhizobium sp. SSUT18]|uniref:MFS transporter n=1 Tax=Bradyrhizobium sp. SSUT18 TaxID=3040602 RepID=UPI00244C3C90